MKIQFAVILAIPIICVGCSFRPSEESEKSSTIVPMKSSGSLAIGKPISEGPASVSGNFAVPTNSVPARIKKEFQKDAAVLLRTPFAECGTQKFLKQSGETIANALSGSIIKPTDAQRTGKCEVRAAIREDVPCGKVANDFQADCEKLKTIARDATNGKSLSYESEILYRKYFFSPEVFSPKEFAAEKK